MGVAGIRPAQLPAVQPQPAARLVGISAGHRREAAPCVGDQREGPVTALPRAASHLTER